jgi:hypothetical protein
LRAERALTKALRGGPGVQGPPQVGTDKENAKEDAKEDEDRHCRVGQALPRRVSGQPRLGNT